VWRNRTVVFDLSGTINLASPLVITNSYLTIAGQTAPGGGITVAGDMTTVQSAHDVVIRDVRFRPGEAVVVVWSNGFETTSNASFTAFAGSYFAGGWLVESGSIDELMTGTFSSTPYQGAFYIDINGNGPGVISTNVTTVSGASYTLKFAYTPNPGHLIAVQAGVVVNGIPLAVVSPVNANSWASLNWQTTSLVFTATSSLTHLAFMSTNTPGASGVLLDAVSLTRNLATNDAGDSLQFTNSFNVMADHISTSWSTNNLVSVLNSTNVTVQWSIMADSLYDTNNPHGFGSRLRYGAGALTFHHNLYADNYSDNPRQGDNLTLDFVNNVIYNWGTNAGYSQDDSAGNPLGFTNLLNYACNYLIAGSNSVMTNIAFRGGTTNTWIFQTNNFIDSNTNGILDGGNTQWAMFTNPYTPFGRPFPVAAVPTDEAFLAYEKVLDFAGVNMAQRDPVDTNIVFKVRTQTGSLIAAPPSSGMVAWWKGENNAFDSVGANDGTPVGGVTYTNGEVGRAFLLNGTSSYITVAASPTLNIGTGSGITIEAWIKPSADVNAPIIEWDSATTDGLQLWVAYDQLFSNINDVSGNPHTFSFDYAFSTNYFQHVAVTYDKASGWARLYINGTNVTSSYFGNIVPQTTYPLNIGRRTGQPLGNGDTFGGVIDELALYQRALSASEIQSIYAAGKAGKFASAASPSPYLDTDQDGIPDFWEDTFTTNLVFTPSNNHDRDGDGYTDLEEYNNWLAGLHALTVTNTPVGVDLMQLCGQTGNLSFSVTNGVNGTVSLTNVFTNVLGGFTNVVGSAANPSPFSNSIAVFTPTNNAFGTNFSGYASFDLYVTNNDTLAWFGPVTVKVVVSAVPVAFTPPVNIISLTNNVPYYDPNTGGTDFYNFDVEPVNGTNAIAVLFTVSNATAPVTLVVNYGLPLPSLSSYDYISTSWVAGESILVTSNSLPVPLANGLWYLGVVNVSGGTVDYNVMATAYYNIVPPVLLFPTTNMVTNILETVPFTMSCVATDLDTPPLPLTFALVNQPANVSGATNVMAIDPATGVITWTPNEAQGPSSNSILVSVSNGAFSITNTFTIMVEESNLPPVLPVIPNQLVIVGDTLLVTNTATDPDIPTNALGYNLTAPVGAGIDTNGIITWTPILAQAGANYLFTTVVTDTNPWAVNAQSLSDTKSFSVTVLSSLPPGPPLTNVVAPNGTNWFAIVVPTNAVYATNILWFATLPVNIWYSTNLPPSTDTNCELLVNVTNWHQRVEHQPDVCADEYCAGRGLFHRHTKHEQRAGHQCL
jgi:hypothetical protein